MALEQVERLQAVAAAPQRLARGGAEAADFLGLDRAALRAGDFAPARGDGGLNLPGVNEALRADLLTGQGSQTI